MANGIGKVVRFQDGLERVNFREYKTDDVLKTKCSMDSTRISTLNSPKMSSQGPEKCGKSLRTKVLSRVFSEDYERVQRKILDPRGEFIRQWNQIFLATCLASLFVDPFFFYVLAASGKACIEMERPLVILVTVLRSFTDMFYLFNIFLKFRTAFIAPSSRVFGRGELVIEPAKIASRYLMKSFWIDLIAMLPLPQVVLWLVIPSLHGSTIDNAKNVMRFIIIFQYFPRLFVIVPLSSQIIKTTGVVTETTWAGAAYNLLLYMLASHVLGACWYLLAVERQDACWRKVCNIEMPLCQHDYLDCSSLKNDLRKKRDEWFKLSNITSSCIDEDFFDFGIYEPALQFNVTSIGFLNKYFYCLWWGLQNLSSLGQNLSTSTYVGEISFAILIAILGLVLFSLLIGNMQTYLQSMTVRLEEWRIRQTDTEEWMQHRQLPQHLRQCVRRYNQYKWVATRGVDEEGLLQNLPMDLRRDIKRHLCLDLVRRVPLFDQMDERMLDAICERLMPALSTEGIILVREGDPVNEMLFIIRGHLESCTTNGGRTGFFNSSIIGPGDFCGEELLTWALDPKPSLNLPSSTRTVKALVEVEAFALRAEDLKFVASQFRRLHSKQLQHTFRFYSPQWRTWAACFIQATWRRFKKRKLAALRAKESYSFQGSSTATNDESCAILGATVYASRFAANTRRGARRPRKSESQDLADTVSKLRKPTEPDFMADEQDEV